MSWKKLEPLQFAPQACLRCPPRPIFVNMTYDPHPGFGNCELTKDGKFYKDYSLYYDSTEKDIKTFQNFENIARRDPDHDWRLIVNGPMYGCVYQRQGKKEWVMVEKLEGFA